MVSKARVYIKRPMIKQKSLDFELTTQYGGFCHMGKNKSGCGSAVIELKSQSYWQPCNLTVKSLHGS
ncbi:hypothetical protein O181_033850 [Austropuccinia psidii MF-1]|uniref:Uncharacterized protein n=1 Tax=Austropuccinia psidii MF-1 TaxID=1389203 RepID=A0A9Q3D3S8_9BASI|nr:hypothetical protein [Austropuccinia psidii MF-1]